MRTFGIEIETVGKERAIVAKAIHSVVGGKVKNEIDPDDENLLLTKEVIYVTPDSFWKVVDDDSLRAPENLRAEIVSPVLTADDIEMLKNVIVAVAKCGAKINPFCGIHIHIGATCASVKDVCRLIDVMIDEEPKLVKDFKCSLSRLKEFAKLMDPNFIKMFKECRPRTPAELEFLCHCKWTPADFEKLRHGKLTKQSSQPDRYHPSRYHGFNFNSYFSQFTIEFRYFDSSLDPTLIEAYVRRCISIANKAKLPLREFPPRRKIKKAHI